MKLFLKIKGIIILLKANNKLKKISKDKDYIQSLKGQQYIKKWIGDYILGILYISPYDFEIIGAEKLIGIKKTIIMSNHKSNYDPFAVQYALPFLVRWFAKKSLFDNIFFGHIGRVMQAFPLDRGNQKQTSIQFLKAARDLKNGWNLAFFPEGARSKTEEMIPFKEQIFAFAQKINANIVPVKLDYRKTLKNKDGTKNRKFIIKILDVVKFEDTKNLTPKKLKEKIFNLINEA